MFYNSVVGGAQVCSNLRTTESELAPYMTVTIMLSLQTETELAVLASQFIKQGQGPMKSLTQTNTENK